MNLLEADGILYEVVGPYPYNGWEPKPETPDVTSKRSASMRMAKDCGLTAAQRVERVMELHGCKTTGQIIRHLSMTTDTIKAALAQLEAEGRIRCEVRSAVGNHLGGSKGLRQVYRLVQR